MRSVFVSEARGNKPDIFVARPKCLILFQWMDKIRSRHFELCMGSQNKVTPKWVAE